MRTSKPNADRIKKYGSLGRNEFKKNNHYTFIINDHTVISSFHHLYYYLILDPLTPTLNNQVIIKNLVPRSTKINFE